MKHEHLKNLKIPSQPGVYFFKKGKEILYIGKATTLKDRIKSYFGKDLIQTRGPALVDMLFQADKIDFRPTDSVLEALILEAEFIKKYQPKYNTKEKSDKSFNYVVITKPARTTGGVQSGGEKLPKVIIVRGKNMLQGQTNSLRFILKGSDTTKNLFVPSTNVFGPYTNASQLKEALKIVRRIFPFLDDKSKNNYNFYKQVDLVPDILSKVGIEQYKKNIKYLKLFFKGKKKDVIRGLRKDMMLKAKNREFEQAGEIKRQLFALQHINDVALLKLEPSVYSPEPVFRIEAYDIAHMGGKNMVGVMVVVENGQAIKSEYKKFSARDGSAFGGKTVLGNSKANDTSALAEILERRFVHTEWKYPNLIVVDGGVAQINATENVLKNLNISIPVVSVIKDESHKPKALKGDGVLTKENKSTILLANSEAHRFAIAYHKNMRGKNFLKL